MVRQTHLRGIIGRIGFVVSVLLGFGCGAEQGPECKAFVVCVEELDSLRNTETNVDRFLPGGACWGGEKGAAVCEAACRRGVVLLHQQEASLTCKTARGGTL